MIYWVETGLWGELNRFRSVATTRFQRDQRVICRTTRGLEVGRVITQDSVDYPSTSTALDAVAEDHEVQVNQAPVSGTVLRSVSADDEMIIERLARHKERAFEACRRFLREHQVATPLVDVEHLFDGQTVYFYFLGQTPAELEWISGPLADLYNAKVRFRQFAERLASGCGPGCGTTASRCGESGCAACGLAGGCGQATQ